MRRSLLAAVLVLGFAGIPGSARGQHPGDCPCSWTYGNDTLLGCQTVLDQIICAPGTSCPEVPCVFDGWILAVSQCAGDCQVCFDFSGGPTVCFAALMGMTRGPLFVKCGSQVIITVKFCSTCYPLACTHTGLREYRFNCDSSCGPQ